MRRQIFNGDWAELEIWLENNEITGEWVDEPDGSRTLKHDHGIEIHCVVANIALSTTGLPQGRNLLDWWPLAELPFEPEEEEEDFELDD